MFTVMMSSVQLKRDEQLTAAEETSTEFKGMAVKEEETEDQRRLLGFPRTPRFTSHRKGRKHKRGQRLTDGGG